MNRLTDFLLYVLVIGVLVWFYYDSKHKSNPTSSDSQKILNYLDSMDKRNKELYKKVDSLQTVKKDLYREYTKVKLKYDTIKITIDSIGDVAGTKLLLSISRQLTAKGIE
jgi:predicted signal transduction protein with EAL and GGDEF domain